jgi:hypothetical protein
LSLGISAIALLFATIVQANAPAPPTYAWFTFTDAASKPVMVQSAQFVECETIACERPVLLLQSGTCQVNGCLRSVPALTSSLHRFDCAEQTCLYVVDPISDRTPRRYYKLIVQFADGVRSSQGFRLSQKGQFAFSTSDRLQVRVQAGELTIAPDTSASHPSRLDLFWIAFGLTQVTELAIAAVVLWWLKVDRSFLVKTLVAIAFINLLTFPVVWWFFPSLQPFHYRAERVVGALSLVVAIVFGLLLARQSIVTLKTLGKFFGGWLLSLPLLAILGFLVLLFFAPSEWLPSASGFTARITLPASELFAFGGETWLIHRVSQPMLSLPKAGLLSLLMNTASLLLGLLLFPTLQHIP